MLFHEYFYKFLHSKVIIPANKIIESQGGMASNETIKFKLIEEDKTAKLQCVNIIFPKNAKAFRFDHACDLDKLFNINATFGNSEEKFGNIYGKQHCDYVLYYDGCLYFIELKSNNLKEVECFRKFLSTNCLVEHLQNIDRSIQEHYWGNSNQDNNFKLKKIFITFYLGNQKLDKNTTRHSSQDVDKSITQFANSGLSNTPSTFHQIVVQNGECLSLQEITGKIMTDRNYYHHSTIKEHISNIAKHGKQVATA